MNARQRRRHKRELERKHRDLRLRHDVKVLRLVEQGLLLDDMEPKPNAKPVETTQTEVKHVEATIVEPQGSEPEPPQTDIIQTGADIKLYNRALREEWPVTSEVRAKVVQELMTLSGMGEVKPAEELKPKVKLEAIRAILATDALNIRREASDVASKRKPVGVQVAVGPVPENCVPPTQAAKPIEATPIESKSTHGPIVRYRLRLPDNGRIQAPRS